MSNPVSINDFFKKRFGNLTVFGKSDVNKYQRTTFKCICDCGKHIDVTANSLRAGNTTSCGCKKIGRITHGLKKHKLYPVWNGMKQRCANPNAVNYKNYGGRGIYVCNEWLNDFKAFYDWCIANGWQQGLELDRRENDGHYEPSNCRFVTRKENMNNTRTNQIIEFNGESKTVSQWADSLGIKQKTLRDRISKLNQPIEKAFTKKHYNN